MPAVEGVANLSDVERRRMVVVCMSANLPTEPSPDNAVPPVNDEPVREEPEPATAADRPADPRQHRRPAIAGWVPPGRQQWLDPLPSLDALAASEGPWVNGGQPT